MLQQKPVSDIPLNQRRRLPAACRDLGDLPYVRIAPEYTRANAGFAFDYQFIDVPDHNGAGETCPLPYFYQNLAEAEYLVSVYMFMRLLGYPAAKISILTTYNGQKALLQVRSGDVCSVRELHDWRCCHGRRACAAYVVAMTSRHRFMRQMRLTADEKPGWDGIAD